MSTTRVLVTDGLWRKSLSAVRSLGKAGFSVSVMGNSQFTTSFWSRFTQKRILAPLASDSPEKFGKALLKFLESSPETILFPMEDASLLWVGDHLEQIRQLGGLVLVPPMDSLQTAQDKGKTLAVARELKIPCPETMQPETFEEFFRLLKTLPLGGFIVKPRTGRGAFGFRLIQEEKSEDYWKSHWEKFGQLLIQERIPPGGPSQGVSILMDQNHDSVASFAHQRLREYPVTGGPSTDRKSIHAPRLVQLSLDLLRRLSWQGIAMVEWKIDPRDQQPKLMEINPRFWGSLELAVRAGVDFPALYARLNLGEKIGAQPDYPDDVRCRWMIPGELLRYVEQPKSDRESFWKFLEGLPALAEEWDRDDLDGFVSSLVCTGAKVFNPEYWKYAGER